MKDKNSSDKDLVELNPEELAKVSGGGKYRRGAGSGRSAGP